VGRLDKRGSRRTLELPQRLTGREMELVSIEIEGELSPHAADASPMRERQTNETTGTVL
jgi:hypothetical protein